MAFQAFLIGLIVFIGKADYFVGTAMLGRPIVLGALVGLALGDAATGTIIGFSLELARIVNVVSTGKLEPLGSLNRRAHQLAHASLGADDDDASQ